MACARPALAAQYGTQLVRLWSCPYDPTTTAVHPRAQRLQRQDQVGLHGACNVCLTTFQEWRDAFLAQRYHQDVVLLVIQLRHAVPELRLATVAVHFQAIPLELVVHGFANVATATHSAQYQCLLHFFYLTRHAVVSIRLSVG